MRRWGRGRGRRRRAEARWGLARRTFFVFLVGWFRLVVWRVNGGRMVKLRSIVERRGREEGRQGGREVVDWVRLCCWDWVCWFDYEV